MTDSRFPERWILDRRLQQLTGDQFRAFVVSLTWFAHNRTDGVIVPNDLPLIPFLGLEDVEAFIANGLWKRRRVGWLILDYDATQSTSVDLDAADMKRAQDRERKRKARAEERARKAAETSTDESCPLDSPVDCPGPVRAPSSRTRDKDKDKDAFKPGNIQKVEDPESNGSAHVQAVVPEPIPEPQILDDPPAVEMCPRCHERPQSRWEAPYCDPGGEAVAAEHFDPPRLVCVDCGKRKAAPGSDLCPFCALDLRAKAP